MTHWQRKLRGLTACSAALLIVVMLTACAGTPTYSNPQRLRIEPTQPLTLPALPDAQHVTAADGAEFAGYTSADVDVLMRYIISAQANTDIAQANADTIIDLNAEAAARNRGAAALADALAAEQRQQWYERIGWLGVIALIGAFAL